MEQDTEYIDIMYPFIANNIIVLVLWLYSDSGVHWTIPINANKTSPNFVTDEGIRMDSESAATLSTNCWCLRQCPYQTTAAMRHCRTFSGNIAL